MTASQFRCPAIRLFSRTGMSSPKPARASWCCIGNWAHDRGVASEYWAKYYLVKDAIRMNRSDGALVRITTRHVSRRVDRRRPTTPSPFTSDVVPLLDDYIPR